MVIFSTVCGIIGTFCITFEHNLDIIKINECLVAKNLLMNDTNEGTFERYNICS